MPENSVQLWVTFNGVKCKASDRGCARRQARAMNKRLQETRHNMSDLKAPMAKVAIYLDQWVQKNFKTEGGMTGVKWQDFKQGGRLVPVRNIRGLSGRQAAGQVGPTRGSRALDTSAKLLQDTGRLRASFAPFHSTWNAGIGSDLPYAKSHQDGAGHIPKRRILPVDREVWPSAHKILQGHVVRAAKK